MWTPMRRMAMNRSRYFRTGAVDWAICASEPTWNPKYLAALAKAKSPQPAMYSRQNRRNASDQVGHKGRTMHLQMLRRIPDPLAMASKAAQRPGAARSKSRRPRRRRRHRVPTCPRCSTSPRRGNDRGGAQGEKSGAHGADPPNPAPHDQRAIPLALPSKPVAIVIIHNADGPQGVRLHARLLQDRPEKQVGHRWT